MGAAETKRLRAEVEGLRRNNPNLRELNYEGMQLGNDGANMLSSGLRTNTNLRRIRLGGCNIGPEGLHIFVTSLCEDRLIPTRLRKLELSTSSTPTSQGNPIGDRGAKSLAFLLISTDSLHHLKVASCGIGDDGASSLAKGLARNSSLKTLDLSNNSISDSGAEELGLALKVNKSLKGLILWHNRIFHTGAEGIATGLASNKTLQWLGLGCNHIGDEGAKALALALLSNGQASALVWLALGGNSITDRGAEHFAVALKLQHASTGSGVSAETDSLTEQIRHGKLRPMLDLGVTPSQVSLQANDNQARSYFEETDGDHDGGSLAYCIPLQSLGLGGNRITCLGAGHLADGLKTNTNLLKLGLADNRISDKGASYLSEMIRCTDTLQALTLSGNEIRDEGGTILMASLTQNTSLQALYLAGNPCGDLVGTRCEEVIGRHNHTLQVLDLHDTRMTSPAAASLLTAMRSEKVLRSLGSLPVPVDGAKQLASLPASGNILEVEERRPSDIAVMRLNKKGNKFSTTIPSQKRTTLDVLGSLPEPEETAQTLVIRQSNESSKGTRKRRGSISHYIKKKLSTRRKNKDSSSSVTFNVTQLDESEQQEPRRKRNRTSKKVDGFEMQPLVEEEDGVIQDGAGQDFTDGGPDVTTESSMFTLQSPGTLLGSNDVTETEIQNITADVTPDTTDSTLPQRAEGMLSASIYVPDHQEQVQVTPKDDPQHQPFSLVGDVVLSTPTQASVPEWDHRQTSQGSDSDYPLSPHVEIVSSTPIRASIPEVSTMVPKSTVHTNPQNNSLLINSETLIAESIVPLSSQADNPLLVALTVKQTAPLNPPSVTSTSTNINATMSSSANDNITATVSSTNFTSVVPMSSITPITVSSPTSKTSTDTSPSTLDPVVSIKTTGNGFNFSGSGGSVPTNSWNIVPVSSVTGSLPRGALQEDEIDLVDFDAVPPTESLRSLTTQRPKPPPRRRLPSKVSPSTSPSHAPGMGQSSSPGQGHPPNQVMRIGGITDSTVLEDKASEVNDDGMSDKSDKSVQHIREQWNTALKKRLGVLKMGGFLHRSFDAITSAGTDKTHDFTAAKLSRNDPKNSLLSPLPPSHTRVKLQLVPDELGSDYINASYVGPPTTARQFIVTQTPMVNTVGDFWRMMWECRVGVVVVLTLEEEGVQWWPEEGEKQSYPLVVDRDWEEESLIVSNIGEQVNSANPNLTVRSITMEGLSDNEMDSLQIFHYTSWPEYGLLASEQDMSSLIRHVNRAKKSQKYKSSPIVVVSKQGAGRAGCFCTIFTAYQFLTDTNDKLIPEQWKAETNMLDQVKGLVSQTRPFTQILTWRNGRG